MRALYTSLPSKPVTWSPKLLKWEGRNASRDRGRRLSGIADLTESGLRLLSIPKMKLLWADDAREPRECGGRSMMMGDCGSCTRPALVPSGKR